MTHSTDAARPDRLVLAARVLHGLVAAIVAVGMIIQLTLLFTGGADANSGEAGVGVPLGTRLVRLFSFFTIQSNVLVGIVAALLVVRPLRDGRGWRVARLDSLLGIIITGVVFDVVLAPIVHLTGWAFVATVCFHYLTPWLALAGWLLFGPRPRFTPGTAVAAFGWPVAWLLYTFVRGALVGWYPYPFLDAGRLGLPQALINALLVLLTATVLAVIVLVVDRRLPALLGRESLTEGTGRPKPSLSEKPEADGGT